jgi:hypothetical protein
MGLFDFLRRKDQQAMPEPGSREFEAEVGKSAIPDDQSVSMGQTGWTNPGSADHALRQLGMDPTKITAESSTSQTIDLRGSGAREQILEVLRAHGIDPDKQGQTIDASQVPGLKEALLNTLFGGPMGIPNAGGFGGGISPPEQDPLTVVERLVEKRDAGEITDAEFEAQKRRILGEG